MSASPPTIASAPAPASDSGWLDVGHGHSIYYEQHGSADGIPVLLLHGGPGSSSTPRQREFIDAARYRSIQFDQRGCGRSTPLGETVHNHAGALIDDIERLRQHLHIEHWLVSGGSWGAALTLAYAARHRERIDGVLLRGTFLTSGADLDWFFHGVGALLPQLNADFLAVIPRRWRGRVVTWLDRCFADLEADRERALRVALAWQIYEQGIAAPGSAPVLPAAPDADQARRVVAKYRVQAHYLARRCFLGEAALLRAAGELHGIPVALVHGTQDWVCRPCNAWQVQRACAGSRLAWAAHAGHDPSHPAMAQLMRGALDAFAATRDFSGWVTAAEPST
ncbi:MAG: alpha/beta fold hydrolase [Rhodanobacter sp.]